MAKPLIVELGIGPGYLAHYLLERLSSITYIGIDFSSPMLDIAKRRLSQFGHRVSFMQADLVQDQWADVYDGQVDAVVSTWALHDLGSGGNIQQVHEQAHRALKREGLWLNGDFIKPAEAKQTFEGGRIQVSEHLKLLQELGFNHSTCLSHFETEIHVPTPAQNYALMLAVK